MNIINRVEYGEDSEPIQVITKKEIDNVIIKENLSQFRLVYSSPILEDDLYEELSLSGKWDLSIGILHSGQQLYYRPEVQEIFKLFYQSKYISISSYITTK